MVSFVSVYLAVRLSPPVLGWSFGHKDRKQNRAGSTRPCSILVRGVFTLSTRASYGWAGRNASPVAHRTRHSARFRAECRWCVGVSHLTEVYPALSSSRGLRGIRQSSAKSKARQSRSSRVGVAWGIGSREVSGFWGMAIGPVQKGSFKSTPPPSPAWAISVSQGFRTRPHRFLIRSTAS